MDNDKKIECKRYNARAQFLLAAGGSTVEIGQDLEVKILRVDATDRKIGLSKKRADWAADSGWIVRC